jgi:hypothetical protein
LVELASGVRGVNVTDGLLTAPLAAVACLVLLRGATRRPRANAARPPDEV